MSHSHPQASCHPGKELPSTHVSNPTYKVLCFLLFIYSWEREAEIQAEGEAGSVQEARCGTWFQVSRPWAEGRCQTAEPPRDPLIALFMFALVLIFEPCACHLKGTENCIWVTLDDLRSLSFASYQSLQLHNTKKGRIFGFRCVNDSKILTCQ